ncbi:rubrerythrin [uncultured Ezakiella sp.]|uniref:rubrerythrin n=1 Tax=uncultured Ezakiella sp. TaxID=1637529 RepID=UPI0025E0A942|nr:rubrerythrin family protein [uncultured Ezakiella sp.]
MKLEGTKTAENLLRSFIGECQAKMRYEYYASQAKKDGYVQIQNIFLETAENEKAHGKRFYKFLTQSMQGQTLNFGDNNSEFPLELGNTLENLKAAADGELEEHSDMYPEYAKVAREEGFEKIARVFEAVAVAEKAHEARYRKLIENIEEGKVFKRGEVYIWKCNNCGYLHEGTEPPKVCPACDHPIDHFEIFVENY